MFISAAGPVISAMPTPIWYWAELEPLAGEKNRPKNNSITENMILIWCIRNIEETVAKKCDLSFLCRPLIASNGAEPELYPVTSRFGEGENAMLRL